MRADLMAAALQGALDLYTRPLLGIDGLFQAHPSVNRSDFDAFLGALDLKSQSDIYLLGYVERVKPQAVAAFTQRLRADGYPTFTITPNDAVGDRYVSKYGYSSEQADFSAPSDFNLASDPVRFSAISAARDSGARAVTTPLTLRTGTGTRRGFIVYLPVYARGTATATREDRQAHLLGVAGAAFKSDQFFPNALRQTPIPAEMRVYVYDPSVSVLGGSDLYLHDAEIDPAHRLTTEREIRIADRIWNVSFAVPADFGKSTLEKYAPPIFLFRNVLLALGLPAFLYLWIRKRHHDLETATGAQER